MLMRRLGGAAARPSRGRPLSGSTTFCRYCSVCLKLSFPIFGDLFGDLLALSFALALLCFARVRRQRRQRRQLLVNRRFQFVVEIFETVGVDVGQRFLRRAVEDQLAAHQHHDLVEELHVLHRVRRQNHGASALGDLAEELHDLLFGRRIESRSRFVKKDHRRFCNQLDGDRDALALAAGKLARSEHHGALTGRSRPSLR